MTKSKIEWTDRVWNPVTGCNKVSQGCKHCYAETIAKRFWAKQYPANEDGSPRRFTDIRCHPERLGEPLRWRKPARVFVNSMSDLFHESLHPADIVPIFDAMYRAKWHTFLILTKRADRLLDFATRLTFSNQFGYGNGLAVTGIHNKPSTPVVLPNVWLGVSVEDQKAADERIPLLLQTPAAVRFVSCEPLLGPVDLEPHLQYPPFHENYKLTFGVNEFQGLDWVIVGGESGHGARPMHPDWARSLRDQCKDAGVPFFFKQWGEYHHDPLTSKERGRIYMDVDGRVYSDRGSDEDYRNGRLAFDHVGKKAAGRELDGQEWNEFPDVGER